MGCDRARVGPPELRIAVADLVALREQLIRIEAGLRGHAAAPDLADVRRRVEALAAVRTQVVRGGRAGWEALTRAELDVVHAVSRGLTNRAAGAALFVSPHTVSTHLRHAFEKLGVHSRVELVRVALGHDR